jgi:hypothetical protein
VKKDSNQIVFTDDLAKRAEREEWDEDQQHDDACGDELIERAAAEIG